MTSDIVFPILERWEQSFFAGNRLEAEIRLLASGFLGLQQPAQVVRGSTLIRSSYGGVVSREHKNPFVQFQEAQPEPSNSIESRRQYLLAADIPDALIF